MDLKERIKLELKCLNIEVSDEIIDLEFEKAKSDICNCCNRLDIPPGLYNTLVDVAIGYINLNINSSNDENLKSIQEGDTTLTFNSKESISKESLLKNKINILNKFRVMEF
ncbi:MAG: hypothetical protein E7C86_03720 [Paeniclostridium sordellii]|nr:hypothetical protein [Paeniclostridium sordellii]